MFTVCQELKSNTNYEKYFDSSTNVDTHMMKNDEKYRMGSGSLFNT